MVVVHNFSKRQKGTKTMETRAVARLEQSTENVKSVPDDRQAFAWVDLDERGNVRIHASERVKGYLDEMMLSNQFQQAYEQSRNVSASSSRRGTQVIDEDDLQPDDSMDYTTVTPIKPLPKVRGRRVFQQAKQRGRPMMPRPVPMSVCRTPSPPETPIESVVASPAEIQLQPRKQMKSFRIDDSEAVVDFLVSRLKRMQQLADKKIAKAWIKGICPKKQAKFPYQNNKQEKETGIKPEVPAWWPDVDTVCRFIEPDHIRREERMRLCLHLLRLRPTPAQLEQWNRFDTAPSKTHQLRGWTAWLKELAGPEIFEDLPREPCHRTKYRRNLMAQMYEVAEMEEEYLEGGIDGSEKFMYEEEDEERRNYLAKRSRRPSTASTPDYEEPITRSASSSCSRGPAKRARRDSVPTNAEKMERRGSDRKPDLEMIDAQSAGPIVLDQDIPGGFEPLPQHNMPQRKVESGPLSGFVSQPPHSNAGKLQHHTHGLPQHGNWRGFDHLSEWQEPNMPSQIQTAPNTFPGRQDFEFPQYQQVQQPFLNHIGHVSQPEFHTVPNTPVFSSAGMVSMPMDAYPMQPGPMSQLPADQHYAMTMAPAQYFMPAHTDHAVADFHPPTNMATHHYQQQQPDVLAERHMAPMQSVQNQGMPMNQPLQWHHHHHQQRHH
ncbi:hypothetical protein Slin15195_G050290 [Septoria linicola]|uniref:Subtelomeric hrmA-associated cluster protein AFUB-079030/YDR124W-like helical bundle domain-containing protein n=1 Tax=Septoria linicola TaxID=215465 RepID=A0A9Q9AMJ0_9PEZI|nr:hypothetical protein Slin15195_G050290 [Septoria linicola]